MSILHQRGALTFDMSQAITDGSFDTKSIEYTLFLMFLARFALPESSMEIVDILNRIKVNTSLCNHNFKAKKKILLLLIPQPKSATTKEYFWLFSHLMMMFTGCSGQWDICS